MEKSIALIWLAVRLDFQSFPAPLFRCWEEDTNCWPAWQAFEIKGRVLGARETHVVSHPNYLPLPFQTPATQANKLLENDFLKTAAERALLAVGWLKD